MGSFSIWHWVIVLLVVVLLFGAGRIPRLAGDMAKGIKAFKSGMKDESGERDSANASKQVTDEGAQTAGATEERDKSVA